MIAEQLEAEIVAGILWRQQADEPSLVQRFGVSRTPIRRGTAPTGRAFSGRAHARIAASSSPISPASGSEQMFEAMGEMEAADAASGGRSMTIGERAMELEDLHRAMAGMAQRGEFEAYMRPPTANFTSGSMTRPITAT
ncbi:MAG: hypothetical protein R3D78_14010 [Paracoccaceae bacterium]